MVGRVLSRSIFALFRYLVFGGWERVAELKRIRLEIPLPFAGDAGIVAAMSASVSKAMDSAQIKGACRLLADHLDQLRREGRKSIWLRPGIELVQRSADERMAELERKARQADLAGRLGTLRKTFVWGRGALDSDLAFVGDAPGAEEEKLGFPFAGPAGQLLDKAIGAMKLSRHEIYFTNIVKHRPLMDGNQGTSNRKPEPPEIEASLPFLIEELRIIRPKVVVALGLTAHTGLTGESGLRLGDVRGAYRDWHGASLITTCHPSYLLRNPAMAEKRRFWEDLMLVMEKLGMEISERQRGFFQGG